MSDTLNTYGLTPKRFWKLFEVEGWQLLVYQQEDEDRGEGFGQVVIESAVEELGERISIKISGSEAAMKLVYDGIDDGPKALQGLLDQVGPILGGHLEGWDVSKIGLDSGQTLHLNVVSGDIDDVED